MWYSEPSFYGKSALHYLLQNVMLTAKMEQSHALNVYYVIYKVIYQRNADKMYLCFFAVVPLLLMFCLCGGVSTLGDFKAIPFDTKQQLISYHTEGQGEDKVLLF